MPNREVNVTKRVQTAKGPRYCPVALSANGRIKPDVVLVNGREERHPEGAYYLECLRTRTMFSFSLIEMSILLQDWVVGQFDPRTHGGVYPERSANSPSEIRQHSPTPVIAAPRSK